MKKIIFISIIFLINACSLSNTVKPDVSLVDVQFSEVTLFETTANFEVRVQNENPFDLSFEGAAHNIYLNGINVGKGMVSESFTVPKLGTATHKVKIHLSNLALVRNIQSLIDAKKYDYKIESTLYRSGSFGLSSYKVTESGSFNKF